MGCSVKRLTRTGGRFRLDSIRCCSRRCAAVSWLSVLIDLFSKHRPKPVPVPAGPVLHTARVEVFDGDQARDEKIPGAIVLFGNREGVTGPTGDLDFPGLTTGLYPVSVHADGF